jgi:fucose permease
MQTRSPQNLRLMLLIAFYSFMVLGVLPGVLNIAWRHMQVTFNVDLDALGVLLLAFTSGRLLMAFSCGWLIGRVDIGRTLLLGATLSICGVLAGALAPAWAFMLVSAFVAAMGAGLIDAGMNTFAAAHYGKGPMNWLHAFFGVGLTIGPLLVTFFVVNLDQTWRLAYGTIAVLQGGFVVALLLTFRQWRMPEIDEADLDENNRSTATIAQSLAVPAVLVSIMMFAIYGGLEISTGQLTNTLFIDSRGVTQEVSSFWISLYWLSFTIGRMIIGSIGDRITSVRLMRLSMGGALLGTLMLWLNFTNMVGFLGLALLGFSLAPMFATFINDTPRRVGKRHVANAIGFQIGFAGLGGAMLAGLAGLLAAHFSLELIGPFLFVNAIAMLVIYELTLPRGAPQAPSVKPDALTG